MRLWGVALLALALAACAPSQASISTAVAETLAAAPTSTPAPSPTSQPTFTPEPTVTSEPTPEPFNATTLEIDPGLIEADVLGLIAGVSTNERPDQWYTRRVRTGDYHLSRQLLDHAGKFAGWVSLFVFQDLAAVENAFELVKANADDAQGSDAIELGDQGIYFEDGGRSGVATMRCHLVMTIFINKQLGRSVMRSYMSQLVQQMEPFVCD